MEVTTAGKRTPAPGSVGEYFNELAEAEDDWDALAIRLGSSLFSKLSKSYQLLSHVSCHPFVIAIQDFGDVGSFYHTDIPLLRYLFGNELVNADGGLPAQPVDRTIESHAVGPKTIQSSWFSYAGSEYVSAILFSNAGTAAKFNRIGTILGLGNQNIVMIRRGFEFDAHPEALWPKGFTERVGDYQEPWHEGSIVIHNPFARNPLNSKVLSSVSQIRAVGGGLIFQSATRHVYNSQTLTFALPT